MNDKIESIFDLFPECDFSSIEEIKKLDIRSVKKEDLAQLSEEYLAGQIKEWQRMLISEETFVHLLEGNDSKKLKEFVEWIVEKTNEDYCDIESRFFEAFDDITYELLNENKEFNSVQVKFLEDIIKYKRELEQKDKT